MDRIFTRFAGTLAAWASQPLATLQLFIEGAEAQGHGLSKLSPGASDIFLAKCDTFRNNLEQSAIN